MSEKLTKGLEILNKLNSQDLVFRDEDGKLLDIPVKGSLGLLALGYKGVLAVKKKRKSIVDSQKVNEKIK